MSLRDRRIVVGVGGGIAAFRVGDVVRELRRAGAQVRVAMTPAASEFITPLTMQSLSGAPVFTNAFDPHQDEQFGHLHLARWGEAFVVAPATADLLARINAGMGNDAVTTTLLAFRGPVLFAPAMNTAMWEHEATRRNVASLGAIVRNHFIGPAVGALADGDVGAGRLAEVKDIVAATAKLFETGALSGKRVLVTAGPTREAFDPVRFISNPSTGKMGIEVARAARARGASVTLVLGPVETPVPEGVEVVRVTTADDMLGAVMARVEQSDFFVAAAAVSDWKPADVSGQKEKKTEAAQTITFVRTPDVLATASTKVHALAKRPVLIGFAAETNDVLAYAEGKLAKKRLDFVVANDVSQPGIGFGSDRNRVTVVGVDGKRADVEGSKREVAERLWDIVSVGR